MKRLVILVIISMCFMPLLQAQNSSSGFSALSSNEKWWVVFHPFKAKRALEVSLETLRLTDSIKKTGVIGKDNNGGHLDAFKHTYWMLLLSKEIGTNAASSLGRAHEKGNYKTFKKGGKEDGALPDKASSEMDLFNNQKGIGIYKKYPNESQNQSIDRVMNYLDHGELKMIKKEGSNFVDCQGKIIEPTTLIGVWENDKCLISSFKY